MLLCELTASVRRLALVGLAKNTGKTETLAALLRELQDRGGHVGVTSVGRDGEARDVIDFRIEKPRVRLPGGSLVATTDVLLRSAGLPSELLSRTGVRTPLGEVLIARLRGPGAIEVAGPSAAADVRAVSDEMLEHGAVQVLIDGAVDRRAASSPDVADGLLMATGAVLGDSVEEVVARTRDAVELVRLPALDRGEMPAGARPEELAGESALVGPEGAVALAPRFALNAGAAEIARALAGCPGARWLIVEGALPDAFLRGLAQAVGRRGEELLVAVADGTRVFLADRGPSWYARRGVHLRALRPIDLRAITVNPVAPQSHRFDSAALRALLEEEIPGVPIFDVLHPDYRGAAAPV